MITRSTALTAAFLILLATTARAWIIASDLLKCGVLHARHFGRCIALQYELRNSIAEFS